MNDYVTRRAATLPSRGEKWDNVWRAYQFMHSTYDAQGFRRMRVLGMAGSKVDRCFR